ICVSAFFALRGGDKPTLILLFCPTYEQVWLWQCRRRPSLTEIHLQPPPSATSRPPPRLQLIYLPLSFILYLLFFF
ncbi:hypothetical protein THAOC_18885, partial [Thalassiosira oceanica]